MLKESIYNVIKQFAGQNNYVTTPKEFIDYSGSLDRGIFLNQLIYWSDRTNNKEGWFFKTYSDWKDEIRLSEYEVRKARKYFEGLGIMETKVQKIQGVPVLHYRLNIPKFSDSFLKFLQEPTLRNYSFQPEETKGTNKEPEETSETNNTKNTNKEYKQRIQTKSLDLEKPKKPKLSKKQKTLQKKYKELSIDLKDIIQAKRKINKNTSVSKWVEPIQLLIEKDLDVNNIKINQRIKRVQKALAFYSQHIGEKYIPVIQSGETLRKKFESLENAMERDSTDSKAKSNLGVHAPEKGTYANLKTTIID